MARALIAATVATAVVSGLVYLNSDAEVLQQFPFLTQIQAFNARIGLPATEAAAWTVHSVIGIAIYGTAFAVLRPILPGTGLMGGVTFGLIAWLAMMVVFAPLAGRPIFVRDLGVVAIALTLGVHVVYGAVLGMGFAVLGGRRDD